MKVVLVFVATLDGKVTKWGDPNVKSWSSRSDQIYFKNVWNYSKLIVMGSSTFSADPIKPSFDHLLVVMTSKPEKYKKFEIPQMVEFRNASPAELISEYDKAGYELMLVVGGPKIAASFLKEGLVNELWLTIEPRIFGAGDNLVTNEKLDIDLALLSIEKVNEQGTLITKYSVLEKQARRKHLV
jgi:dihydrofolate reductase